MTQPDAERTEEPTDRSIDERSGFERRPLLKALGVGAVLSLGSGVATAGEDQSDEAEIDPHYGFPTPDAEDVPEELAPDHEVELHRVFPDDLEDPEHPSFFHFEPSGLQVSAGDIVQFTFTDPNHTVTAYHPNHGFQRRVPEAVPAFSSPIVQEDGAWLYRFEREGLYDMYCGPHEIAGMATRIVVGELAEEDVPDYEDTFEAEPPLIAPLRSQFLEHELNANSDRNENVEWVWPTDGEVLATDALDPVNIQEASEVSFAEVADELDLAFEPDEAHEAAATVQVRDHPEHVSILVGPDERTLYMFEQDTQGAGESSCLGDCAEAWPPLTVEGEPTAGEGVEAELTTFEREDGATQVAANGWPLYYFARDAEPGDAQGQGANDAWWVLWPDGTPITSSKSG